MLFSTIKRQNIYVQVIEHLKRYIIENALQPGDRLPTEAVLSEQLGVSRLSIREALKVMESFGIVQTKPRDGSRLMSLTMKSMTDHLRFMIEVSGVTFEEMASARCVLECAMLPIVIENAQEIDMKRMEELLEKMRECTKRGEPIVALDIEFHQVISQASKNRVLDGIGAMIQEFFQQLVECQEFREEQWQSVEEHEQIYKAICERDIDKARKLMVNHLSVFDKVLLSGESEPLRNGLATGVSMS